MKGFLDNEFSSFRSVQGKTFYTMDEVLIANFPRTKAPGYTDAFSNRSVFISLRFQIDPLWFAYSNVCVFMIVFIASV